MNGFRGFLASGTGLAMCLAIAALGAYLLVTHTGHVVSALPYILLLGCPLMHFFFHGHKHKHSSRQDNA